MKTIFLAILLLGFAAQAQAVNIFNWNADSRLTSLGNCTETTLTYDTAQKHAGAASLRLTVVNSDGQIGCEPGNSAILGNGNEGTWYYYRWWMKIDSGFVWGTGQKKMKANRVKNSGDVAIYTNYMTSTGFGLGECAECLRPGHALGDASTPSIVYDLDPATNPNVSNWQEYIIGFKHQTCSGCQDAQYHVWVNGVEVGTPITDVRICSSFCTNWVEAWGSIMVRPYPQLQSPTAAGGTIWVDDFSMDTIFNHSTVVSPCSCLSEDFLLWQHS